MSVMLLTEHHLEFLSLKGGCTGSSESALVRCHNCWKSHAAAHLVLLQGSPQWVNIDLEEQCVIDEVHVQFQGGFAGRDCWFEGQESADIGYKRLMDFYPEDSNSLQVSFH